MKKEIIEINPFHIEWNKEVGDKSRIVIWGRRPKGEVHYEIRIKFTTFWGKYIAKVIRKWFNAEIQDKINDLKLFEHNAINDNQL